jgi:hypothetical protein
MQTHLGADTIQFPDQEMSCSHLCFESIKWMLGRLSTYTHAFRCTRPDKVLRQSPLVISLPVSLGNDTNTNKLQWFFFTILLCFMVIFDLNLSVLV